MTRLRTTALGIAGATALGIGAFVLMAPGAFHAGHGIALEPPPNLLRYLRASAAGLVGFGCITLAGIIRTGLRDAAIVAAFAIFLAHPAGRLLGIGLEGMSSNSILAALILELFVAVPCLIAFRPGSGHPATDMTGRSAGTRGDGTGRLSRHVHSPNRSSSCPLFFFS